MLYHLCGDFLYSTGCEEIYLDTFWSALRSVDNAVLLKWLCSSTCAFAFVSENCHSFGS